MYVDADNQAFFVSLGDQVLKCLDIRGLHYGTMDLQTYLLTMKQEARSIDQHRRAMWQRLGEVD